MTSPSIRSLTIALILAALVALALHFAEYIAYAIAAVRYRFGIFDAEGIVWQQAKLIPGPRMYGDIDRYPFIVFHYPPVFHLLVRGISMLGFAPLLVGRAISVAATLATAAMSAQLTWRLAADAGRFSRLIGGAVAGLVFFCFYPVVATSPLMRVDILAIALSFAGFLCFATAGVQSMRLYGGMAFFVLAVFTKQTSVAAPLAAIGILGFVAPRKAMALLGFGILLGAVPLSILMWATHGEFLRHMVLYNINRYDLSLAWGHIVNESQHFGLVLLALIAIILWWRRFLSSLKGGALAVWRRALAEDANARAMAMTTLYLGICTAMLAGLGKSGATIAYFDEGMALLSVFIGVLVAMLAAPVAGTDVATENHIAGVFKLLLPVLLIAQVLVSPASLHFGFANETQAREADELVGRIARADKPVLSDDMVMLMLANKDVPWEPAIFAELAALGRWDETHIVSMIAAHEFAFVITRESTNFSRNVYSAVGAAYPRTEKVAGLTLHLASE